MLEFSSHSGEKHSYNKICRALGEDQEEFLQLKREDSWISPEDSTDRGLWVDTIVCYTTYTTKAAFFTFWVIRSNHNVPSVTVYWLVRKTSTL